MERIFFGLKAGTPGIAFSLQSYKGTWRFPRVTQGDAKQGPRCRISSMEKREEIMELVLEMHLNGTQIRWRVADFQCGKAGIECVVAPPNFWG